MNLDRFSFDPFPVKPHVLVAICANCDSDIYEGDDVYQNSVTQEYFCCQECAIESIDDVLHSIGVDGICEQCGEELFDSHECVVAGVDAFCDDNCLLKFNEISEVTAK